MTSFKWAHFKIAMSVCLSVRPQITAVPIIGPFPKFSGLPVFVGLHAEMYGIKMAVFLREGTQQDGKIWLVEHMLYALHIQT